MPTTGELTDSAYDLVTVPGTSCSLLWIKSTCTRTVCSLANHFTPVDKQWKYDIHGATTILYTTKLNIVAYIQCAFTVYPENADIRWTYRLPSWRSQSPWDFLYIIVGQKQTVHALYVHWLTSLRRSTTSDNTTFMVQQVHHTQEKLNKDCCRDWMYIHCLPRKCRHPVNLQTGYMTLSESLGLPVHYYGSNALYIHWLTTLRKLTTSDNTTFMVQQLYYIQQN